MAQAGLNPVPRSGTHWAALGEHTFVGGIWLLYAVHRLFGRAAFRVLSAPVVLLHWCTRPALRAASLDYLRRLHAARPGLFARAPGWREGLRHVACFAETMLDKLLAMAGRYPAARISERGVADVDVDLRAGRGGIFVTAHMGCLELCRAFARDKSILELTVLVHTKHAESFNRLLQRLDPQARVRLMEVSEFGPATAVQLQAIVAEGGWVAIAGDRVPIHSAQVAEVQFLGHTAPLPVGPYVLASLLRCPLVLVSCLHKGAGYEIRFERLAERVELPRGQRAQALQRYAQSYADAIAAGLAESPYDWFNFYAFWERPDAPPTV